MELEEESEKEEESNVCLDKMQQTQCTVISTQAGYDAFDDRR